MVKIKTGSCMFDKLGITRVNIILVLATSHSKVLQPLTVTSERETPTRNKFVKDCLSKISIIQADSACIEKIWIAKQRNRWTKVGTVVHTIWGKKNVWPVSITRKEQTTISIHRPRASAFTQKHLSHTLHVAPLNGNNQALFLNSLISAQVRTIKSCIGIKKLSNEKRIVLIAKLSFQWGRHLKC